MKRKEDNTTRKEAEEALRLKEEDYRTLAENSPDLIARFDRQLRHTYVNPAAARAGRLSASKYIGKTISESGVPEPVAGRWEQYIRQVLETGQLMEVVDAFPTPDGIRYFNTRFIPELAPDGSVQSVLSVARDITERKKAEEALRDSEERFRRIIENAPVGYYRVGKDGLWQFVNPAWESMHGFSFEEVVGKSFEITQTEDMVEQAREYVRRSLAGETITDEFSRLRKDGNIEWHIFVIQPVYDGSEIVAIEGFIKDITERKRVEEALRRSEALLNATQTLAKVGGWEWDVREQKMFWTDEVYRLHDFPLNDPSPGSPAHIEKSLECYDPADRPVILAAFQRCVEKGESYDLEFPFTTAGGRRLWIRTAAHAVREDGKIVKVVGDFLDITERKRAEEAVRESEEHYRILVENQGEGIGIVDPEERFIFANPAAEVIFGVPRGSLVGRSLREFTTPEQFAHLQAEPKKRRLGKKNTYDVEIIRPDGERRTLLLTSNPQFDPEGRFTCTFGIFSDISERKRVEETLVYQASLLANVHDAVIAFDEAFMVTSWNQAAEEMYGWKAEEVIGRTRHEVLQTEYVGIHRDEAIRTLKETGQFQGELIQQHRSGQRIYAETKAVALKESSGRITGYVSVNRDITERKRAEEAFQESEAHYRLLAENVTDVIWTLDMNLRFTYFSPSIRRQRGYSVEEAKGLSLKETLTPASFEKVMQTFSEEMALEGSGRGDPRRSRTLELENLCKDGSAIWTEVTTTFLRDPAGRPVGILGVTRDITERKRVEEALRENEAMSRAVLEHSPVGISIRDQTGALLQVNEAWKKIWAMSDAEIQENEKWSAGRSWKERCPYLGDSGQDLDRLFTPHGGVSILYLPELEIQEPKPGAAQRISMYLYALRNQDGRVEKVVTLTQDITERKRSEAALRESEEKYRLVVDHASDAILVAQDGMMKFVNPRVQEITGYSEGELTSRPFPEFIHPEDRAMVVERHQRRLQGKPVPPAYPFRIVTKAGEDCWVEIRAVTIPWQGKPATLNFLTDITERRKTEEALRKNEAKYRELVENANSIILRRDPEGRITFFNEFAQRFFGFREEEILGRNIVGTIVPEKESSGRDLAQMIRDISRHPERYATNENENVLRSGERVWVAWTNKPVLDPDGKLAEILCIGNDLTERKRAEEKLEASERRYRTLVEGMSEAVMQVDNNDVIQFVNPQFCQMLGYREEEILGKVGYEIYFDPEEQEMIRRKNLLRQEKVSDAYETRMKKKSGEDVLVRISGSPVTDVQGNVVGSIGVITDITQRRRLEEDVLQLQKMEAIGRLSGGVAHDFNNLLQGIMGFAERALRKLPEGDPLRKYLEGIEKTVDKAASLTNQLLTFSRKQVFLPVVIDINEIIRESDKILRRLISEDIEIVTRLDPKAGRVKVDPIQIEQVIMNLAVNSGDAMPKGGRLVLETANVELDQAYLRFHPDLIPGSYVMLTVSDTGCGMDAETLEHIFEPFFTTKETGKGTGLGLATVYGIVHQSGGGIEVKSAPGRGTTIRVYLPREIQEATARKVAAIQSELPGGTETVLLVEDEKELRDSMREDLSHSGYTVLEAENGEAAFRLFSEHPGTIHLLITDVVMPKMSGPDLAQQLAALHPEMKVIFISGYPAAATLSHGLNPLGLAFLQKPFKSNVLLRKVREVLNSPKEGDLLAHST